MNNPSNIALGPADDWMRRLLFLPERASTFSAEIDHLHYFVIGMTMAAASAIFLAAVVLYMKYRRKPGVPRREVPKPPSLLWELCIIFVPLSFFLLWFFMGFQTFVRMETPPADSMDIYVMGKKWMWKFAYPGGPNAINTLRVPEGRDVRLLLTSRDVIHSFYVPEMRIKQDVVPGRTTQMWFNADRIGTYDIFCTEYCGTGHSTMHGRIQVMEPAEFDKWISAQREGIALRQDSGGPEDPDELGTLTMVQLGKKTASDLECFKCHTIDGSSHIGPTWLGLYHRNERLTNGTEILVDEAYLTKSMMDPMADIVLGYAPVMPTYQGKMTAPQAAAIVEYIRSLEDDRVAQIPNPGPSYEPINALR